MTLGIFFAVMILEQKLLQIFSPLSFVDQYIIHS